jgi:hypothetical protein
MGELYRDQPLQFVWGCGDPLDRRPNLVWNRIMRSLRSRLARVLSQSTLTKTQSQQSETSQRLRRYQQENMIGDVADFEAVITAYVTSTNPEFVCFLPFLNDILGTRFPMTEASRHIVNSDRRKSRMENSTSLDLTDAIKNAAAGLDTDRRKSDRKRKSVDQSATSVRRSRVLRGKAKLLLLLICRVTTDLSAVIVLDSCESMGIDDWQTTAAICELMTEQRVRRLALWIVCVDEAPATSWPLYRALVGKETDTTTVTTATLNIVPTDGDSNQESSDKVPNLVTTSDAANLLTGISTSLSLSTTGSRTSPLAEVLPVRAWQQHEVLEMLVRVFKTSKFFFVFFQVTLLRVVPCLTHNAHAHMHNSTSTIQLRSIPSSFFWCMRARAATLTVVARTQKCCWP